MVDNQQRLLDKLEDNVGMGKGYETMQLDR